MKIKVTYAMTEAEKKAWDITPKFGNDVEFEPKAERIQVKGLKPAPKQKCTFEKYDFDQNTDEGCKKITGLTPAEYQAKYHRAWNA